MSTAPNLLSERIDRLAWTPIARDLDRDGVAPLGAILDAEECSKLAALYDQPDIFRSTINMAQHRFGQGEYRYFAHPLPNIIADLRAALWPHLLPIARSWAKRLNRPAPWPDDFGEWIADCHTAGQTRPTPLILRYYAGDWNALHRDLYGDLYFPLQVVVGLDAPGQDYTGGEFVVVDQRPRAQSRATTYSIPRGHGLAFTTSDRPIESSRGWAAAAMRHGVSTVHSGCRHTAGIVFHDAA